MNSPDEEFELRITPRPAETMTVSVPIDTLDALQKVAANKDMSLEGLVKFYVGQGLRNDLSQLRANRTLEAAQQVLTEYFESDEAAANIVNQIRQRSTLPKHI
ncbi:hypothetical protein PN498_11915 [Oscillatoria sp. CS-180]|uniref:hypothetical protein n=1 Tax=Oscillatoria sp. CS-180 TaxID=3021720 RepID=UPI00233104C1|nr:hypothetical protein [Oscillatoria sp. CS-180]MDB9526699.1 hypothetical protein [Oscillatoria sp. CS-180]